MWAWTELGGEKEKMTIEMADGKSLASNWIDDCKRLGRKRRRMGTRGIRKKDPVPIEENKNIKKSNKKNKKKEGN